MSTDTDQPALRGRVAYLVGIGGCGMSGLARVLARSGVRVSGSDVAPNGVTGRLEEEGIRVSFDQRAGVLPEETDLVIASAAIPHDHPEMLEASSRGVERWSYAEALGRCMIGRTGVAVAGTHG
ncbi:MAG: Mur ligase domain-containing protein, partial [Planctomycetota bacterium]